MRNVKYILVGILCAFVLSYVISAVYNRYSPDAGQQGLGKSGKSVCVYEDGEYSLMDVEEYTASTLAGMMNQSWNDEMLRTMAVVIRTGIYYQMNEQARQGNSQGGTLINESELREIRYNEQELKGIWDNQYRSVQRRAAAAVADTYRQVLLYDGQPIMPAYHMVSIGHTVSAREIYGYDIPYLRQTSSDADRLASNFSSTVIYSEDRLRKAFQKWIDEVDEQTDDIRVSAATESGFATAIDMYGAEVDAETFRDQLGLQSTNIHIDRTKDGYRIITIGVGDSLGLSLYGATVLSENGESYEEILAYYYAGAELSKP